jgi:hypothetical protein
MHQKILPLFRLYLGDVNAFTVQVNFVRAFVTNEENHGSLISGRDPN